MGNQCHSFGAFNLTQVELDWLAVELSEWLSLPIQTSGEVITSNSAHSSRASAEVTNSQSSSTERTSESASSISLTPPIELKRISRPENVLCSVDKDIETIEISAPVVDGVLVQALVCVLGLFLFVIGVQASPIVALVLGTVPIILWKRGDQLNHRSRTTRIVLRIDRQEISLWEQSQSGQQRCIKKTARSAIHKLQLFYKEKEGHSCHIKVCTAYSSDNREDGFLIGNRSFWLSRREAEWLADELGIWLGLPVKEVEVIDNSA